MGGHKGSPLVLSLTLFSPREKRVKGDEDLLSSRSQSAISKPFVVSMVPNADRRKSGQGNLRPRFKFGTPTYV